MKLILTNDNSIGKVLANPIYTENGAMFLNKGNTITPGVITRLRKMGVTTIYIEDGNDEVTLQEVLPADIKLHAIKVLKEVFDEAKNRENINLKKVEEIVRDIMDNVSLSENAALISNLAPNDEVSRLVIHCVDVTILTIMVGIGKKYDEKKLMKVGTAALLHDIGKLFINDKYHVKKGQELMKRNPSITSTTYMAVYYMYEREDGSGLFGAIGEKVHEFATILGICNEYINNITGEKGMLPHVAIEKITAEAVNKFDIEIFKDFLQTVYCYPNGLHVRLSNGQEAVVVMQNSGSATRPVLAVYTKEGYRFCNLIENQYLTLFIEEVIM
jgi:HD-GYP domain-containing protein (c-di-GMP phosphodiesterase class II)